MTQLTSMGGRRYISVNKGSVNEAFGERLLLNNKYLSQYINQTSLSVFWDRNAQLCVYETAHLHDTWMFFGVYKLKI